MTTLTASTRPTMLHGLATLMICEVLPPMAAYYAVRSLGHSAFAALLTGTLLASARTAYVFAKRRRLDGFSAFMAGMFVVGLAAALITSDPRWMIARESAHGLVIGLAFLVSAIIGRPLTLYAYRRITGVDPKASGRRPFTIAAVVWGSTMTFEALIRLALIAVVPPDVMVGLSTAMNIAMFSILGIWTMRYRRQFLPAQ